MLGIDVRPCGLKLIYFVYGQSSINEKNVVEISSNLMIGNLSKDRCNIIIHLIDDKWWISVIKSETVTITIMEKLGQAITY